MDEKRKCRKKGHKKLKLWVSLFSPLRVKSERESSERSHHWPEILIAHLQALDSTWRMEDKKTKKQQSSSAKNTWQSGCGGVRGWTGGKITGMDGWTCGCRMDRCATQSAASPAEKQVAEFDRRRLRQTINKSLVYEYSWWEYRRYCLCKISHVMLKHQIKQSHKSGTCIQEVSVHERILKTAKSTPVHGPQLLSFWP